MNAAQLRHAPAQLVGFSIVAGMHLLLGWALVSGLAHKVVDVVKGPVETKLIEELKPPPLPEPALPPPEFAAAPPPSFVPPPEVRITPPLAGRFREAAKDDLREALTDEKGYFAVAQVPAETLDVAVRKRGFAPAFVRGIRVSPGKGAVGAWPGKG